MTTEKEKYQKIFDLHSQADEIENTLDRKHFVDLVTRYAEVNDDYIERAVEGIIGVDGRAQVLTVGHNGYDWGGGEMDIPLAVFTDTEYLVGLEKEKAEKMAEKKAKERQENEERERKELERLNKKYGGK